MKLISVEISSFRAIQSTLPINFTPKFPNVTVFHGANAHGKTTVLEAIAIGLSEFVKDFSGRECALVEDLNPDSKIKVTAQHDNSRVQWSIPTSDNEAKQYGPQWGKSIAKNLAKTITEQTPIDMPLLFKYYGVQRMITDERVGVPGAQAKADRNLAHYLSCSGDVKFSNFIGWFAEKHYAEMIQRNELHDFSYTLPELDGVRKALETMIPELSDPRIDIDSEAREARFFVNERCTDTNSVDAKRISDLAGGYQVMLALVGDLVLRMMQANPHKKNALESEAIVLIDEVDLHLHPKWQQRVIPDLTRTFPNTQFIVSTHSPQVLTTLRPEQVYLLNRLDTGVECRQADNVWTFGAKAGDVLEEVMDVPQRPDENEFSKKFDEYKSLINKGEGETNKALKLRSQLERWSPRDPGLRTAKLEIIRRRVLGS